MTLKYWKIRLSTTETVHGHSFYYLPANAAVFADVDSFRRITFGTILAILSREIWQTGTLELAANATMNPKKKKIIRALIKLENKFYLCVNLCYSVHNK